MSRLPLDLLLAACGLARPLARKDKLAGIDIPGEYALIQRKQSRLSSRMRRLVVARARALEMEAGK